MDSNSRIAHATARFWNSWWTIGPEFLLLSAQNTWPLYVRDILSKRGTMDLLSKRDIPPCKREMIGDDSKTKILKYQQSIYRILSVETLQHVFHTSKFQISGYGQRSFRKKIYLGNLIRLNNWSEMKSFELYIDTKHIYDIFYEILLRAVSTLKNVT